MKRLPVKDMLTFLGPRWTLIIGIAVIGGVVIFVGLGAYLDFREWRRRPPRVKKK